MKRGSEIEQWLKPLAEAPHQAYLTNALQVADVLEWILGQLGKATVWQTSFSISEEFLRRLYFIKRGGQVKEFNLVLDHKATNKTVVLWPFITQVISKTFLADNHSKVLLVQSEKGEVVTVVTSQNLTRGNRAESAFISTDLGIFTTMKNQIQNLITNHSVPLHDLYRNRTATD